VPKTPVKQIYSMTKYHMFPSSFLPHPKYSTIWPTYF
jgi:hypothetical protein